MAKQEEMLAYVMEKADHAELCRRAIENCKGIIFWMGEYEREFSKLKEDGNRLLHRQRMYRHKINIYRELARIVGKMKILGVDEITERISEGADCYVKALYHEMHCEEWHEKKGEDDEG